MAARGSLFCHGPNLNHAAISPSPGTFFIPRKLQNHCFGAASTEGKMAAGVA
jgi:hypothetical protein